MTSRHPDMDDDLDVVPPLDLECEPVPVRKGDGLVWLPGDLRGELVIPPGFHRGEADAGRVGLILSAGPDATASASGTADWSERPALQAARGDPNAVRGSDMRCVRWSPWPSSALGGPSLIWLSYGWWCVEALTAACAV